MVGYWPSSFCFCVEEDEGKVDKNTKKNAAYIQPFCPKTLENKNLLCNQNKILCSQTKLACCRCSDSGEWHEMRSRRNSILGLQYFSTWALLSEYLEQTRTMQELILPAWEASQSEHRIHSYSPSTVFLYLRVNFHKCVSVTF